MRMLSQTDSPRYKILKFLYEKHKKARGPKAVALGIREIQRAMRLHGVKSYDVVSNLDYLLQRGLIKKDLEIRTFTTPRGNTRQAEKPTYKISDFGIDMFEDDSDFKSGDSLAGFNLTSLGGITVIGSGNVLNLSWPDLLASLADLERALRTESDLSEESRLTAIADIKSIQTQLSSPKPDLTVIRSLWSGVERMATTAGVVDLVSKIAQLMP